MHITYITYFKKPIKTGVMGHSNKKDLLK